MGYGTRRFNAAFTRPNLSRINPIHRIDTYLFKVHSNIVLPATPKPPKGLFPVGLPVKILKSNIYKLDYI